LNRIHVETETGQLMQKAGHRKSIVCKSTAAGAKRVDSAGVLRETEDSAEGFRQLASEVMAASGSSALPG
jgi:hypothetical protein